MAYKVSAQFSYGVRSVLALTASDAIDAALHYREEKARSVVIIDPEGRSWDTDGLRDRLQSGKVVDA